MARIVVTVETEVQEDDYTSLPYVTERIGQALAKVHTAGLWPNLITVERVADQ